MRAEDQLADHVPGAPSAEGGDAVLRLDRGAVMESKAGPQAERVGQAIGTGFVGADHLRARLEGSVHGEQRVVDQVGVLQGDKACVDDWVHAA